MSSPCFARFDRALASRGANLVLVARLRDRLDVLADELTKAHGVTAITQDLSSSSVGADLVTAVATAGLQVSSAFLPDMFNAGKGFLIKRRQHRSVHSDAADGRLRCDESVRAELHRIALDRDPRARVTVFALSPGATSTEFNAVVGTDDANAGPECGHLRKSS